MPGVPFEGGKECENDKGRIEDIYVFFRTIPSKKPSTQGHIELAIVDKKKDIINLMQTDDLEGKTTDLVQINEIKYVLRLTRKEAQAEVDGHYDCCMFLRSSRTPADPDLSKTFRNIFPRK